MGRVKYIIVNEKNLYIESLLRQLIKLGINYVIVDNEIHFLDNIVRILDPVEDRYLIMDKFLEDKSFLVGNDYIKKLLGDEQKNYFDIETETGMDSFKDDEKVLRKTNFRFDNKRNNKMINNRLRNNRKLNLDRR